MIVRNEHRWRGGGGGGKIAQGLGSHGKIFGFNLHSNGNKKNSEEILGQGRVEDIEKCKKRLQNNFSVSAVDSQQSRASGAHRGVTSNVGRGHHFSLGRVSLGNR